MTRDSELEVAGSAHGSSCILFAFLLEHHEVDEDGTSDQKSSLGPGGSLGELNGEVVVVVKESVLAASSSGLDEHAHQVIGVLLLDVELDSLALIAGELLAPEVALAAAGDNSVLQLILFIEDFELFR